MTQNKIWQKHNSYYSKYLHTYAKTGTKIAIFNNRPYYAGEWVESFREPTNIIGLLPRKEKWARRNHYHGMEVGVFYFAVKYSAYLVAKNEHELHELY